MRNLKRALSMALAAIMVLGLMVVGASAAGYEDFTDKDEIKNTEAVSTMVSLGVISGKEDGSYYDPNGSLTRAEACTLIARMLGGGKDPVLGSNIKSNFTDTKGHWAETYIAYCANLGIIVGVGDGSFNPDGVLTGTAAAKMMLCALGYKPEFEGIGGANWELATNTLATKVKLYDGLNDLNPSETISRDDVAQLLYNGVQADEVEYRNLEGDYSGTLYAQPVNGVNNDSTMLSVRFNVVKVEGVVVANDIMALDEKGTTVAGKVRLNDTYVGGIHREKTENNVTTLISEIYPIGLDNSYLGQRVVLYVKGLKDLAPNAASTEVVGLPILSQDNTVATTASRLGDADAVRSFLADSNLSLPANGVDSTAVNGTVFYTKGETQYGATPTRAFAVTETSNVNGTELTFIDHNGDGVVDYIFKTLPQMAKVTAYNETDKELTIAGEGAIDFDDIANEADVAKDDVVLYYQMNDTYYLTKAETVSGKVVSYDNSNKTVTMDGTAYGKSTVGLTVASTDLTAFTASEEFINNTYTFYLDGHGNVVGWVLGEETLGNYALIVGTEGTPSNVMSTGKVKLLLADGTTATYDVNLLASANRLGGYTGTNSNKELTLAQDLQGDANHDGTNEQNYVLVNRLVTYSVGDDKTVTLTDPTTVVGSNFAKLVDNGSTVIAVSEDVKRSNADYAFEDGSGNPLATVTVNDSTLFFVNNGTDDATVVQGLSNLPVDAMDSLKGSNDDGAQVKAVLYTTTESNKLIAKAVFVDGYYAGTKNFVYVSKEYTAAQPLSTGETIYTYPVVFENGEAGTIQVKGRLAADEATGHSGNVTIAKGNVYEYSMNGGYAELSLTDDTINGMVTTWARGNAINVLPGDFGGKGQKNDASGYTVATDAQKWNVENTSNVIAESLSMNMSVAFGLDAEGLIKTIFVRDTDVDFCKVVNNTGANLTFHISNDDGNYGESDQVVASGSYIYVANGFSARIADGTAGGTVTYDVTYENSSKNELDQTANIVAQAPVVHSHSTLASVSVSANSTVTIKKVGGVLAASAAPTISAATAGTPSNELGGQVGTVTATGNGTLSYQWYQSTDAANNTAADDTKLVEGTNFTGVTTATLNVNASYLTNGTPYYFYCVVTNTESGKGGTTATTSVLTVTPAAPSQDNVLDSLSTAEDINNELVAAQKKGLTEVTLTGDSKPDARIDIPAGMTLKVTGNFTDDKGVRTTGDGKLEVAGSYTNNSGVIYNVTADEVELKKATALNGELTTGDITGAFALTVSTGATLTADSVADDLDVSGTATISGAVTGAADVKTGGTLTAASVGGALTNAGTATISGTVTGNVTVDGGTASVADVASTSTVAVNGGKLTLTGATLTTTGGITMAGGELDASACDISNSKLKLTAAATATVKTLSFATATAPVNFAGGTITVVDAISASSANGTSLSAGTWNFTGMFTLDGTQTTTIAANTTVNFNGGITFAAADKLLSGSDNTSKFTVGDVTSNTITGEAKIKDFGGANAAGTTVRDLKGLSFEGAASTAWNCTVDGTDWS